MPRKKVTQVEFRSCARRVRNDPEQMLAVRMIVYGGRGGDEVLADIEKAIPQSELAAQLFPDMPQEGDMWEPRKPGIPSGDCRDCVLADSATPCQPCAFGQQDMFTPREKDGD